MESRIETFGREVDGSIPAYPHLPYVHVDGQEKKFQGPLEDPQGQKIQGNYYLWVFLCLFFGILIHFYSRINRVKITIWVAKAIIIRLSWTLLVDHWTPLPPQQRSTPGFNSFWTDWLLMPPPSII